jgi:hypothetical protein
MGEVYRADDLKLGQPVALKFLPGDVDRDAARLTQLHTEVRMARQVSHPNVCRVYDIDEVEGHTFLSMEYVDGEDLASLLKRVGRFPEERGLEIARQMCAGLAAAHERGVIHRDFKPANVMIDAAGKVRITDFGLAGAAGESIRAGTPAYMAPEQIAGRDVTVRSDIYALGLVLYEIFTGQRALEGRTLAELIHKREQSGIVPPSAIVRDLHPQIEQAIMRCLRPEPAERPALALSVSAALPGGDPLAAALAAGETPSPEMVAAAGTDAGLHPAVALLVLAFIVVGLIAHGALGDRRLLAAHLPPVKSLDALEDRARELAGTLQYAADPAGRGRGLAVDYEYLSYVRRTDRSQSRWEQLRTGHFPVLQFWYRGSLSHLVPLSRDWKPSLADPPMTEPGMVAVTLDQRGRLLEFRAVPPRYAAKIDTPLPPTAWQPLFDAAGLKSSDFIQATPRRVPSVFADEHVAWEGPHRDRPEIRLSVEAASYARRPVYFKVSGPWALPADPGPQQTRTITRVLDLATRVVTIFLLAATIILARKNLTHGRADLRGATRVSVFTLMVWFVAWAFGADHYRTLSIESQRFTSFVGSVLLNTCILWLAYVALEPYVRRLWPVILISWTRILAGRARDARLGRDVLVGILVGVVLALVSQSSGLLPQLFGNPPSTPRAANLQFLLGGREAIGNVLRSLPNGLQSAMLTSFAFVMVRVLVKRAWIAVFVTSAILGLYILAESGTDNTLIALVFVAALVIPLVTTLLVYGLVALATAFFVNQVLNNAPLTADLSKAYAAVSLGIMLALILVSAYSVYIACAGRWAFKAAGLVARDEGYDRAI